ncbi:retrotransposon protein, putative, ty1-copia subclass, partial [Tanacetum coccineum]
MVRSMMNLTTLSLSFWDYALESATRILNMVPTKKVDKTPYELWYGKVLNLSYLKVWGCEALVKRDTPDKLEQRSVKCIFIGYPKETMGYYFYFPPENKIIVARSERTHRAPNRLCLNVEAEEHSLGDLTPTSYKAVMLDLKSNKWLDAMNAEMQSMKDNQVWRLVDLLPDSKGFTQLYGVDYEETFSPVADIRAIRILIAIAAFYDYEIWQMDVKTALFNGYLDED